MNKFRVLTASFVVWLKSAKSADKKVHLNYNKEIQKRMFWIMDSVTCYGGQYLGAHGPSSKCPLILKVISRKDVIFQNLLSSYNMRSMIRDQFPGSSAGEKSAFNAGNPGTIPGSGRSPGEGVGYPLQYSGLENSMDCIVDGVTKSQTQLSDFHYLHISKYVSSKSCFAYHGALCPDCWQCSILLGTCPFRKRKNKVQQLGYKFKINRKMNYSFIFITFI